MEITKHGRGEGVKGGQQCLFFFPRMTVAVMTCSGRKSTRPRFAIQTSPYQENTKTIDFKTKTAISCTSTQNGRGSAAATAERVPRASNRLRANGHR